MTLKATYYLEVTSSWCHWAEPAWAELKRRYSGRIEFDWKIALLDSRSLPTSKKQAEWFYRRSGTIVGSPYMLNPDWYEPDIKEYLAPNCVAVAARDLGVRDDTVRIALAEAGLRKGRRIGQWEIAVEVASHAASLDQKQLLELARSPETQQSVRASTLEFHDLQVSQRPTFVFQSEIGDFIVHSGTWRVEPLVASIESMLMDSANYAAWKAHFWDPPDH